MRAEEKNMVERIMDTETMGYAYEYPYGGGARKEYMLALTSENLANFIGARGYDAKKIVITDVLDRLIVNTCMGMLDVCPDQKLCGRIIEYLAPIQLGEKEAGEILAVERNVADEYFAMEDEEVTMAECQMLAMRIEIIKLKAENQKLESELDFLRRQQEGVSDVK